ncbi:uncharacterized protein LOC108913830 [Anoplophora glabripennis]|uniref:uncharacterized protein LOC108913830 n=1 Tax=Anoplophora glabripennis TaxID=217634 RepID=UPI0008736817|nr:uncharacterized protein LOC108913830 [Anoplophora glabripennis]XP_018574984.1 uncharacterized protein LOC108913830 [Anoplophora glabripennis]
MGNWKRPEEVPFPSIWRTFERRDADGVARKYWVQDLTPEYEDIFIDNMKKIFLKDEPVCKYSNFAEDPQAVQDFTDLWRYGFSHKLGIICLTEDENGKIEFVGGNMTALSEKGTKGGIEDKCKTYQKVLSVFIYVTKKRDIFNELNINEYLTAFGLFVLPKFRGQGIATEILKARRELCLAVGIKASATIFTSIISQKNARQAGFKDFVEIDYDDLEKINPMWNFPGITSFTKSIKYMYIQYS